MDSQVTQQLITTIASVVLSSSSGLRAYLPLLALGIAVASGVVPLEHGYGILNSPWLWGGLAVLTVVETVADKIPGVDHVSDIIHTVVRPIMGAVIFGTTDNLVSANWGTVGAIAAPIIGGVLAGGVHGAKAVARVPVTATTVGVGNPIISTIEDVAVIALVVLALIIPVVALLLLLVLALLFALVIRWAWRRLRGRKKKEAASVVGTRAGG
jgi:hypothetical protein